RLSTHRHSRADRILAHRTRSEASDRGSFDWPHAARLPQPDERPDPRDSDARPRGVETAAVPIDSASDPETLTPRGHSRSYRSARRASSRLFVPVLPRFGGADAQHVVVAAAVE